jgi:phosphohistidine swiveling domain-containing protein
MDIKGKNWELYVSRPFTLFGSSLWCGWYFSKQYKKIIGANAKNCLMIEYPKGRVRYYRDKNEQKMIFSAFSKLVFKRKGEIEGLLKKGLVLNKKSVSVIKKNDFKNFGSAVDFLIELSLFCTVLPFRLGDFLTNSVHDKKIFNLVKKLRMSSYYEQVINKVVIPLAFKELKSVGLKNKEEVNFLTLNEILDKKKINIQKRIVDSKDKFFVYQNNNGVEKINWIKDPMKIIKKIEGSNKIANIIKGNTACGGLVRGIVRLVTTNDIQSITFNKGDILVSTSTSPILMPLIKKCGAIITDEGGLTCHAAIISRELKIPCVIGTKIATQTLKNGDEVEVDANEGLVKILNRRETSESDFIGCLQKSKKWSPNNERDICLLMRDLILNGEKSSIFNEALGSNIAPIGDAMVNNRLFSPIESVENVELALLELSHKHGFKRLIEISQSCSRRVKELHQYLRTKNKVCLIENLTNIQRLYTRVTCYLLILVFSERFLEEQLKKLIKSKTGNENSDYFKSLVYVKKFNESSKELIAILKLSRYIKNKKIDINGRLAANLFKKHLDNFSWISARYHFEEVWQVENIKLRVGQYLAEGVDQKLKDVLAPRKEAEAATAEFIKKFKLNLQERQLIDLVKEFVFLRTFRTESLVKANFLMKPILRVAAKKLKLSVKDVLFLSIDEVISSLRGELNYKSFILSRKKGYYIVLCDDIIKIFADKDRKIIDDLDIFNVDAAVNKNITGQIAWRGIARGAAKIVKSQIDIAKVNKGDILVATMTFPNYIAAMEKAAAFVTDEGGILCHAAIIAREMKKPCVIGTKIATQTLKNGDEVEVNANVGMVKIIKSL